MRKSLAGCAGAALALAALLGGSPAAGDDTVLTISHVEPSDDGSVNILLSVPVGVEVDLDGIKATFDGTAAESSAEPAGEAENEVRRTTIIAMDTSDSMEGDRFDAAKAAAETFMENVPGDVFVGIVTFDSEVATALPPTTDRGAANEVIEGLELARGTRLYEGVTAAVALAGIDGQRSILVLSDGKNSNTVKPETVTKAITEAGVNVDAVALDQAEDDIAPLQAMATAGNGEVISSDPEALAAAFTAEAASLSRQILVTASLPESVTANEATVRVSVPGGASPLVAQAFAVVRGDAGPDTIEVPSAPAEDAGLQIPEPIMYGAIAAIGVGLLILLGSVMTMASGNAGPRSVEQRIAAYGATAGSHNAGGGEHAGFNLDQAKGAAASMLRRNKGLEARIEQRLEAGGSALKSSEWLLIHGAITIVAGLAGALVGGGDLFTIILLLALGAVIPWMWLGRKRKTRLKKFNAGLADTLQLMAGSLSAGMSMAQSMDTVVKEGNEPIAGEFKRALIESRLGVPLEATLEGIAARTESQDFAWVVMAIRIQRQVGGNLAELLTTVAATMREREYLRRQVLSLSAEGRLSAYILFALPVGMLLYMITLRRSYVMPLFTEPLGLMLCALASFLLAMGWFAMSRIVKVEV
jgi:tight adherence protein B